METGDAQRFALKIYFRHAADKRDRLASEYNSFSYLWTNGFREIPQPLTSDPALGWAVYQFIDGDKIPADQVGAADIAATADLLGRLRELSRKDESRKLGPASEAFFAVNQIVDNVSLRLTWLLDAAREQTAPHQALRAFLLEEFKPFLEQAVRWSESRLNTSGQSFTEELDWTRRTLSPSDFGFHNTLRQPDGRLIFLDFEYFGWDDPAKMIADFLLHPAMNLSAESRKQFASAMFRRFSDWPGLLGRVESVYPLFGLKWCMIILNEFLPQLLLRRQFAAIVPGDLSALQMQQLDKARQMLNRISREYERFPYHD